MQPNLVGQKLGKYTIREMLGMGGMGAVYRAYQEDLRREVALKVIAPNFTAQEEVVARFIREAQTAASLEHAHIVPIYDYGVINGQLYIVMRHLTGGTLAQRIDAARKSGRLPTPGECAALLDQLAGALDYAHERGVIHRDIKPGNIMFDNHGDAFLVDFGIAKAGDSTNLTRGSSVIGSPHYMAPEQWRGDPATAATDQYALAVVLFTMLTGKLPFEAETPYAVMQLHINTPPPSPTLLRADLSPGLGLVMERAMAKDSAARFPSMRAFSEAFRQSVGERMVGETGFFTRPLETMRTVVMPGGSGSQPGAAAAAAGAPSGSTSQSLSQTIRQQRVGLAVGLGAGLIIAIVAGVLLLMQNRGTTDLDATATAEQAALVGMANLTETAENAALIASPTVSTVTDLQASATPLPPTETLTPTWTPSWTPSATLPPSATPTPSHSAEQIAASATTAREAEIVVTVTERAVLTRTAQAEETAAAQATQAVETAAAQALETLIAGSTVTSAAIAANAAATLQAEQQATQAAISVAATLDAIVQNTRAANNAAASATTAAEQATRDAQTTQMAAAQAAGTATQTVLDARATGTAEALSAAQTATQTALDARATGTTAAQTATQTALDARATDTVEALWTAQTATQAALDMRATRAADQTATQTTFDAQATEAADALWTALTATQAALDARATDSALTASAQQLATASAATAARNAELLAAQATLSALQTEAANLTATAVVGPLTATAGGVSGTMAALNARATALRATATARAAVVTSPTAVATMEPTPLTATDEVSSTMAALNARATALRATATARAAVVTSPTATTGSRVLVSLTPTLQILASPTLLPSATQLPEVGRPGIFSPGDLMERRVLTTEDDGFIRTVYLCCAASDLFVEIAFETPDTTAYWDVGVAVREQEAPNQELRFFVTSNRTWHYGLGAEIQANGTHNAPFNTRSGTINRLTLVAFGETGIALLNGEIIAVLDFSAILSSGDIYIGTEFADGSPPGIDIVIVSANVGALDSAFGPSNGILPHRAGNGGVESIAAEGVQRGSFIAQAVLGVPYPTDQSGWDIGFDFRKPGTNRFVRLIVDAMRQTWYLYDFNREFTLSESGPVGTLRLGTNDVNALILVAVREHGYLIVNGQPVARFELPMIPGGGAVELGSGFFSGNEIDGEQTTFSGYTVWTFADQP